MEKHGMDDKLIEIYRDFWPYYLCEYSHLSFSILHYIGTTIAISFIFYLTATLNMWAILGALVSGCGFAWMGHLVIKKNHPATFTYPFWPIYSDFRIYFLAITGRLGPHLANASIANTRHVEEL